MLQGSLFFTAFHNNRYWTTSLEVFVLFHGVVVAYLSPIQSLETVKMFGFGFLTMFIVTQIYGLGLARRWLVAAYLLYGLLLVIFYQQNPVDVTAVIRIPVILLTTVFAVISLVWFGLWLRKITIKNVI